MQNLAWTDFAGTEGSVFQVEIDGGRLDMTLEKAAELPSSGRPEGSFRLDFRGPADPLLPQAIYRFHRSGESAEIFIVPIERDARGTLYEAIFY
jgi:hypothetical protein